ncbi:MAG TPA: glucosamine-6-phosphate deaminase [Candidatus Obscuribacterales bacterium]
MTVDYKAMSLRLAEAVADQLRAKPASCLGLPTGRTPLGLYETLAEWSRTGALDWRAARCFALDEYIDVPGEHSFACYLDSNIFRHTNLPESARFNPLWVDDYDACIAAAGGLDLTIVGIGINGHIAFNEPGTPLASWTHCAWLTESTRRANAPDFGGLEAVPSRAVTMGLTTIMSSRKVILIASGQHKQGILSRALTGPVTAAVPASYLQVHPALTVLTDFGFEARWQPSRAVSRIQY